MDQTEVLTDAFGRIQEEVHAVLDGLDPDDLAHRPDDGANSIGWLIWHLTRVQDDHVAGAAGHEQVWTAQGWNERFGLPFPAEATGYAQGEDDIVALGAAQVAGQLLAGYFDAVHAVTVEYVRGLSAADLDRVVDTSWNPPVTLGVRLVSVISDDLQHVGQAAYVRGLL